MLHCLHRKMARGAEYARMKPVPTKDATHNYGPPVSWNQKLDGACGILSVRMQPFGKTERMECISTWKPSAAEIKLLVGGGVVILSVVAGVQPPVAVWAEAASHDEDNLEREPGGTNDGG